MSAATIAPGLSIDLLRAWGWGTLSAQRGGFALLWGCCLIFICVVFVSGRAREPDETEFRRVNCR